MAGKQMVIQHTALLDHGKTRDRSDSRCLFLSSKVSWFLIFEFILDVEHRLISHDCDLTSLVIDALSSLWQFSGRSGMRHSISSTRCHILPMICTMSRIDGMLTDSQ